MNIFLFHLLPLLASFTFAAAASAAAPVETNAANLYHDYCSVCHGDRGDGRSRARQGLVPPPRDFTEPGLAAGMTRERMISAVLNGVPNTAMVGWKTRLSRAEAEVIVDHMRANFMRATASGKAATASAPRALPVAAPAELRGDVKAGQAFYDANCATCHGVKGDGQGPRAYFIFPKPRNFLSREARAALTRPALFRATKEGVLGREMPAWGKVLSDQEIADVSEYVYRAFIRGGHPG
ncbi:MAG TPA: c-type cytochrome [Sulfuricaulis sp.]|nr:c-type cytochrome [Sulfuricaulis sp.]